MGEPSRTLVLEWMAHTGQGATDAARHFFPGASPQAHKRLASKYRNWKARHGLPDVSASSSSTSSSAPSSAGGASSSPSAIQAATDVAAMATVDRLEWQVARAAGAIEYAMAHGDVRAIAAASKVLAELGDRLDKARAAQARSAGLQRGTAEAAERLNRMHEVLRRVAHAAESRERTL